MHSQGGMRALWTPVRDSPGAPSLTLGRGAEEEQGLLGSGLGTGDGGQVGVQTSRAGWALAGGREAESGGRHRPVGPLDKLPL